MSDSAGWIRIAALETELDEHAREIVQLRAERDALLPVVEAAKAWRERFAYDIAGFKTLLLAGERDLVAAVDALQPTEGAQP